MSMKRTKKASSSGRGAQAEGSLGFNPPTSGVPDWAEITGDKPDSAFVAYAPAQTYGRNDLVQHAKFGRGVVLAVDGSRIEVLFQEGVKKLGHGVT